MYRAIYARVENCIKPVVRLLITIILDRRLPVIRVDWNGIYVLRAPDKHAEGVHSRGDKIRGHVLYPSLLRDAIHHRGLFQPIDAQTQTDGSDAQAKYYIPHVRVPARICHRVLPERSHVLYSKDWRALAVQLRVRRGLHGAQMRIQRFRQFLSVISKAYPSGNSEYCFWCDFSYIFSGDCMHFPVHSLSSKTKTDKHEDVHVLTT